MFVKVQLLTDFHCSLINPAWHILVVDWETLVKDDKKIVIGFSDSRSCNTEICAADGSLYLYLLYFSLFCFEIIIWNYLFIHLFSWNNFREDTAFSVLLRPRQGINISVSNLTYVYISYVIHHHHHHLSWWNFTSVAETLWTAKFYKK